MESLDLHNRSDQLLFERRHTYRLLMLSAGMMGGYTFVLRGGVFCNAQTANVALMAVALGQGHWLEGLYFLIPITAYFMGAFLSELFLEPHKRIGMFCWGTWLIAFEAIILFGVGFIPLTASDHYAQVIINFVASMQYNSFRRMDGIPMSTTFCTNHIRQVGITAAQMVRHSDPGARRRCSVHVKMLLSFFCGGICEGAACGVLGARAIWLTLIPLLINLALLIHTDIQDYHAGRMTQFTD